MSRQVPVWDTRAPGGEGARGGFRSIVGHLAAGIGDAKMGMVRSVVLLIPLLASLGGYLVDGASGAVAGLLVPTGPLLIAWLSNES